MKPSPPAPHQSEFVAVQTPRSCGASQEDASDSCGLLHRNGSSSCLSSQQPTHAHDYEQSNSSHALSVGATPSTCFVPALCQWIHHHHHDRLDDGQTPFRNQVVDHLLALLVACGGHDQTAPQGASRLSFQQVRSFARELLAIGDCCLVTGEIDRQLAIQLFGYARADLSHGMSFEEFDLLMNHPFWDEWLHRVIQWKPRQQTNRSPPHEEPETHQQHQLPDPNQAKYAEEEEEDKSCSLRRMLLQSFWPFLYAAIMIGGFVGKYYHYGRTGVPWETITGQAMAVAQAFTQVALLHALLLVLPVSRYIVALLRVTRRGALLAGVVPPSNLHRFLSTMLLITGLCHGIAQCVVFVRVSEFCHENCDQFFEIFRHGEFGAVQENSDRGCECVLPKADLLKSVPAITGYVLIVLLALMMWIYSDAISQNRYHVFEKTHKLLAMVFTVVFCIHGIKKWIEPLRAYHYVVVPLVLIVLERIKRFVWCAPNRSIHLKQWYTNKKPMTCQQHQHHQSQDHEHNINVHDDDLILTLVFDMPASMKPPAPASFAYLSFPQISALEWHPFTIFWDPSNHELWFYVKIVGDWTQKLHDLLLQDASLRADVKQVNLDIDIGHRPIETLSAHSIDSSALVKCLFDGPIATTTTQCTHYESLAFIAGGCGIVPFLSVLSHVVSVWYSPPSDGSSSNNHHQHHQRSSDRWRRVQHIQVVWVVRHLSELEAFTATIEKCLQPLHQQGAQPLLESYCVHDTTSSDDDHLEHDRMPLQLDFSVFVTCSSTKKATQMTLFRSDLLHRLQTHLASASSSSSAELPLDIAFFRSLSLPFIKSSVHFGRPDWQTQLHLIKRHHEARKPSPSPATSSSASTNSTLGVFVCGNESIQNEIQTLCRSSKLRLDCLVEEF